MLSLLGCLILLLLGAMCATEEISKYRPSLRIALEAVSPFRGYIGIAGMGYGSILFLRTLSEIGLFPLIPFVYMATVSASLVCMAAGALLAYPTLSSFFTDPLSEEKRLELELLHKKLLSYQTTLGYAALALGLFHTLLYVVTPEQFCVWFSL